MCHATKGVPMQENSLLMILLLLLYVCHAIHMNDGARLQ